jgi:DNA polymerase III sliding clamp (beta) subunit (PCNA family)
MEGTSAPGGVSYGNFSFQVKRWVLAGLADAAAAALPATASVPALGCYRVRVSEGFLELAATDMERTVLASSGSVSVKDVPEMAYQEVLVPARKLQAILKEAPDSDVVLTVKKNQATLTAGGGTWTLTLPDGGSYPELISAQGSFTGFSREKFLAALRSVRHVVSRDAGRPPLTQAEVRADPGDETRAVVTASDGSRFARARIDGFHAPAEALCIPSSALDDLVRLLAAGQSEEAGIVLTEEAIVFRVGSVILSVARRSTPFPDVDKLLLNPALENNQELSVSKDELAAAVRRVRINADGETSAIVLELGAQAVTVVSRDKLGNSATEDVPAKWTGTAGRVLCLNHVFLAEMLSAHPDNSVQLRLGKDVGKRRSQVLLQGDGLTQILSQMIPSLVGY